MKRELRFPKYEDIQKLETFRNDEYKSIIVHKFELFKLYKHVYCRMSFNEEGLNVFYLDMMCNGYCDGFGDGYKMYDNTKEDYNRLKDDANKMFNDILQGLLDCSDEVK